MPSLGAAVSRFFAALFGRTAAPAASPAPPGFSLPRSLSRRRAPAPPADVPAPALAPIVVVPLATPSPAPVNAEVPPDALPSALADSLFGLYLPEDPSTADAQPELPAEEEVAAVMLTLKRSHHDSGFIDAGSQSDSDTDAAFDASDEGRGIEAVVSSIFMPAEREDVRVLVSDDVANMLVEAF
ncbi:hypothetical protein DFJ74DRAFT_674172 [Hyaloraphidium curvatum]|nr:hypothetical protein DFJ74DRAFT_674172 [Hyaloraphidium curvatum]